MGEGSRARARLHSPAVDGSPTTRKGDGPVRQNLMRPSYDGRGREQEASARRNGVEHASVHCRFSVQHR